MVLNIMKRVSNLKKMRFSEIGILKLFNFPVGTGIKLSRIIIRLELSSRDSARGAEEYSLIHQRFLVPGAFAQQGFARQSFT